MLALRSVPGESDIVEIRLPKNKHGPRDERFYLDIDRRCQTLTDSNYEPPPEERTGDRDSMARERVAQDAVAVARALSDRPGMGVRELRAAVRAMTGAGVERVDAALALLGAAVIRGSGPRNSVPLTLDAARLPTVVRMALEAAND